MYTLKRYLILIFKFQLCLFSAVCNVRVIFFSKEGYNKYIYLSCNVEEMLHCSKNYEYIFNYMYKTSVRSSKEHQSYKKYII